jgi:hypothetical protein
MPMLVHNGRTGTASSTGRGAPGKFNEIMFNSEAGARSTLGVSSRRADYRLWVWF